MTQAKVALVEIQGLGSSRKREDLKRDFNRVVRTRMLGGVGGVRREPAPIPIRIVMSRLATVWRGLDSRLLHHLICLASNARRFCPGVQI